MKHFEVMKKRGKGGPKSNFLTWFYCFSFKKEMCNHCQCQLASLLYAVNCCFICLYPIPSNFPGVLRVTGYNSSSYSFHSLLFCTLCVYISSSEFQNTQCILMLAMCRGGAVLVLQYYKWTEEDEGLNGFFSKVLSIYILKSVDNVVVQPLWKSLYCLYAKTYLLGQWHNLD